MYHHHWHINYPILFLILGLLLLTWAITYSIANAPSIDLPGVWSEKPQAEMAASETIIELAPGFSVPQDYFIQEKMYHAPLAAAQVELAPGFSVPQDYFIQEKMYHAPLAAAQVELAPGFSVPLGYYVQEKMVYESPTAE